MTTVLRRIFRERRRLFVFASSATMSGYLWFQGEPEQWLGLPISIWMALAFGLGLSIPAILLTLFGTTYRHALETVGIALLAYSLVMVRLPDYSFLRATGSLAPFVAFLIVSNLVHVLIYGSWSERFLRLRRHSERGTAHTWIPRESAWRMLLPSPQQTHSWDPTVTGVEHVEGMPSEVGEVLRVNHLFPDGKRLVQQIRLDHMNPGQSIRYHYSAPEAVNGAQNEQTCAFVLEERGPDLVIHVRWDRSDYPARRALMHWIDDWAGRSLDMMIARVEAIETVEREEALKIGPITRRRDGRSGI